MAFIANYTIRDLAASVLGCLLFLPLLLTPGYVAAWLTNIFGFRALTSPWRLLVSLPASVALSPIATYWAGGGYFGRPGSWTPVFAIYGICFLLWLLLLAGLWGHESCLRWLRGFASVPRAGWIVAVAWFCIAIASLVNLQIDNRLYLSVTDWDHVTRAAFTDAITRTGAHPSNPFYFLGGTSAPLRYHYFWFLLCSLVTQLGNTRSGELVPSQEAIIASIVWCGWSLIALVPLYLRFFEGWRGARLRRGSLIGIALFAVTGLDIVPTVLYMAAGFPVLPDMEWWNNQVTSWLGSLLWVPHHVAALVSCLMGFLVSWDAALAAPIQRRIAGGILAGAAFATATGTSIYVTLVFAAFLILWALVTLLRGWRNHTAVLLIAGAVSVGLAAPFLLSLLTGPGTGAVAVNGGGSSFLALWIRTFFPVDAITSALQLSSRAAALLDLATLPLNYFLELGFFGVVAVSFIRCLRRQPPLQPPTVAALLMFGVSVLVSTFVRSGVIATNDLGWRGFLPAQFVMLLWGAEFLMRRGERAMADIEARARERHQPCRDQHSGDVRIPDVPGEQLRRHHQIQRHWQIRKPMPQRAAG